MNIRKLVNSTAGRLAIAIIGAPLVCSFGGSEMARSVFEEDSEWFAPANVYGKGNEASFV